MVVIEGYGLPLRNQLGQVLRYMILLSLRLFRDQPDAFGGHPCSDMRDSRGELMYICKSSGGELVRILLISQGMVSILYRDSTTPASQHP